MSIYLKPHSGFEKAREPQQRRRGLTTFAPATGDIAVDEAADFGYLLPPSGDPNDYLSDDVLGELDELGNLMVPDETDDPNATPDSQIAPVFTYWGQFLDHELTARTDRDSAISDISTPQPSHSHDDIESTLKNARTPRFDLDSVYGGIPVGPDITPDVVKVITGMRHPSFSNKMRVGTAHNAGPLPDNLDPHRDLPRFGQVEPEVRAAFLNILRDRLTQEDFEKFEQNLPGRALIGDMRNDENLIVAQFHLSFLRFHNRAIDFLEANDTGWSADFHAAQTLTRLHYQYLIAEEYLKTICDEAVVQSVLANRAKHFFSFRNEHASRNGTTTLGNALPLEFSVAAFRFGHTMVRNTYDYNKNFGRPGGIAPSAPFDQIFAFTGGGGFFGLPRVPENWVIDWTRFVGTNPMDSSDGQPARNARSIDTLLAPPLGDLVNEGKDVADPNLSAMFRHLARRNLRRGLNLRLPTGQALHQHLHSIGAVQSMPIANVANILNAKPELKAFLEGSSGRLHERTPLWFYCLAEAEAAGGDHLGELGSWIVASTFIAVLLSDPDSALSKDFEPSHSPLRLSDGAEIDTLANWMRFALVME